MPVLLSAKAAKMNTLAIELSSDSMTAFVEGWTKGMLSSKTLSILSSVNILLLSTPGSIRGIRGTSSYGRRLVL